MLFIIFRHRLLYILLFLHFQICPYVIRQQRATVPPAMVRGGVGQYPSRTTFNINLFFPQNTNAPFPYVFDQIGWTTIKWIVTIGAICALCTSLLGCMFPLPRIIYAMSSDGLLFRFLAEVHPKTKTPLVATVISGLLAGLMATVFNLQQLIDMMSIGTLLAYTVVAICVLILRYSFEGVEIKHSTIDLTSGVTVLDELYWAVKKIFNLNNNKYPDRSTCCIARWNITIFSKCVTIQRCSCF